MCAAGVQSVGNRFTQFVTVETVRDYEVIEKGVLVNWSVSVVLQSKSEELQNTNGRIKGEAGMFGLQQL
jgi:hypothetical protein